MKEEASLTNLPLQMEAPALAGHYLRSFSEALRQLDTFDKFHDSLTELVRKDSYLFGSAELSEYINGTESIPDFEALDNGETVLSVAGAAGNAGFLKYKGRKDGEPFGAEDLHLMGAIAGFISVATAQAERFKREEEAARVFQYLINQLPLGVVCYRPNGELLVENKLATRLLGSGGTALLAGVMEESSLSEQGRVQLHLEADDKLLYTEGRFLEVDDALAVKAFVLYDMSKQREKLILQLERAAYRTESRGSALTLALLEDRSTPGHLYAALKESKIFHKEASITIQPLDAYSCVAVFENEPLGSVRRLLRNALPSAVLERDGIQVALVSDWQAEGNDSPADLLLGKARARLCPLAPVLQPAILVLDPYTGVIDALSAIISDAARLQASNDIEEATAAIQSESFDAVFIDVDSYPQEKISGILGRVATAGTGFRVYYLSHLQPDMVRFKYGIRSDSEVLQKPFDAAVVSDLLAQQFNFA